jgi:hypothetical protein
MYSSILDSQAFGHQAMGAKLSLILDKALVIWGGQNKLQTMMDSCYKNTSSMGTKRSTPFGSVECVSNQSNQAIYNEGK